jgi:D-serine deaminase-like pyridoxal phosphate-dependent protein
MHENIYSIADITNLHSPSLIVFLDLVKQNIEQMIRIAGDPNRLRPHCKTHKISEVVALQQQAGIHKFKCATLSEAEMLARANVQDILLAYNPVGPNIKRVVELANAFPKLQLSVTVDHPLPLELLSQAASEARVEIQALLDLDTGLQRTGVDPQSAGAMHLYELICSCPGIKPGGLHWYDGQHHQRDPFERRVAIEAGWQNCLRLKDQLFTNGLSVPRVVAGGTGSFPIYAEHIEPELELSPGTVVFHDAGYLDAFPDLKFTPAALVLTRVISCPSETRMTLDAGTKAIASDPPFEKRATFPELPDARIVLHNEEHLVIETKIADQFAPGDPVLAIPWHICPTTALHESVYVCEAGQVNSQWRVAARNR